MGVSLETKKRLNAVRIISRIDDAVDHDNSDWDKYADDPIENEMALKFLPDKHPTIFVCNFEFNAKENAKIQDAMLSGVDDDGRPKPAYGAWTLSVVKSALKTIQNHESIKNPLQFKVDSRGYASEETLNTLQKLGIIEEIFGHYTKLTQTGVKKNLKN